MKNKVLFKYHILFKRISYGFSLISFLFYTTTSLAMSCTEPPCDFSFMLDAEVRVFDKDGIPCFGMGTDKKQHPEFRAIIVAEASPEKNIMWQLESPRDSEIQAVNLSPPACLVYGSEFPNGNQQGALKKLTLGKVYTIILASEEKNGSLKDKDHLEQGYFCLLPTKNGGIKVQQLSLSDVKKTDGSFNVDACGASI